MMSSPFAPISDLYFTDRPTGFSAAAATPTSTGNSRGLGKAKYRFLASLAFHSAGKYQESFHKALEQRFGAFDAAEVARRSHQCRIKS